MGSQTPKIVHFTTMGYHTSLHGYTGILTNILKFTFITSLHKMRKVKAKINTTNSKTKTTDAKTKTKTIKLFYGLKTKTKT